MPNENPLLRGSRVEYFEHRGTASISRIIYPQRIQLCGIIQIDKNAQFYFISRNQNIDDMNPYFIPSDIPKLL